MRGEAAVTGANLSIAEKPTGLGKVRMVGYWCLCFVAPICLLCVTCAWNGVFPFGGTSFLATDLMYQYIDFFAWFRRTLLGDGNLFYSFSQSLGQNTWGQYSYYLASPLNVIVLLFSNENLTMAVFVIDAIKLGLMQVAFVWAIRKRFRLPYAMAFVLGLSYSWCAWVVFNVQNPLWLDALYLYPLIAIGCWSLATQRRWKLLLVSVSAAIMTCWYMGYASCLFASLYVVAETYLAQRDLHRSARGVVALAAEFAVVMIAAVLLSAWTFVPTVLAMGGTATAEPVGVTGIRSTIAGLFLNSSRGPYVPQIYSGSLPLILTISFLVDPKVKLRERLVGIVWLAVAVLTFTSGAVEYVWCGFSSPHGFFSRTAYLVTFGFLWMSGRELSLLHNRQTTWREVYRPVAIAVLVACVMAAAPLLWGAYKSPLEVVVSWAGLAACGALVSVWSAVDCKRPMLVVCMLACVTCAELVANAHVQWETIYPGWYTNEHHVSYVAMADEQAREMATRDPGVYRMEKTYTRSNICSLNENLAEGYMGISSYSSARNPKVMELLGRLGYANPGEFSVHYRSSMAASDSILGLKYTITDSLSPLYEQMDFPAGRDGYTTYSNPYALPIGYGVSENALDASLKDAENPFEAANAMASALLGRDVNLYVPAEASVRSKESSSITWNVTTPPHAVAYTYVLLNGVPDSYKRTLGYVSVDGGKPIGEGMRFSYSVLPVDAVATDGQPASHSVTLYADEKNSAEGKLRDGVECIFYYLDVDAFRSVIAKLGEKQFVPTVWTDGHVEGTYEAENDGYMMLTVPYDTGWSATVDGQEVELKGAVDATLMAIPVHAGTNNVAMSYVPPGLRAGVTITGCTLAGVIAIGAFGRRSLHRKRETVDQ